MDFGIFIYSKIMEIYLKWVHMARYELILRLDRALWLTIIFKFFMLIFEFLWAILGSGGVLK